MSDKSNDDANNAARRLSGLHYRQQQQQQQLSQQRQTSIRQTGGQPTPRQTVSWGADVNQVPFNTPHVARPFHHQVSSNATTPFAGWTPMQQQAALQAEMARSAQQMTQGGMSTPGLASIYASALPSTQRSSHPFQPTGIGTNPQVVNQWMPQQQHGIHPSQLFGSNTSSQSLARKPPPPPPPPSRPEYCIGLNNDCIDAFGETDIEYLANHFGRLHNKWRSQMCLFVAPTDLSTREADGWKVIANNLYCPHCITVRKNLYRHTKRLNDEKKTVVS